MSARTSNGPGILTRIFGSQWFVSVPVSYTHLAQTDHGLDGILGGQGSAARPGGRLPVLGVLTFVRSATRPGLGMPRPGERRDLGSV